MSDFLKKILLSNADFLSAKDPEKFCRQFFELYRIEIFKDGLDLILTKLQEKQLRFEVRPVNGWDTNIGCFLTEQKSFFDKTLGKVFRQKNLKIILRQMTCNVMAHEMAHALEFESGLDLGEEFRRCIALDMNGRKAEIMTLRGEVQRLMVDALKAYQPHQFLSELFARYFELLSISRDVKSSGDFASSDVTEFFANVTNFVTKIFNPKIRAKIDPKIAQATIEIVKQVKLSQPEEKFQERIESRQKQSSGSWAKGIKSNSMWQQSWKKFQELEEKK